MEFPHHLEISFGAAFQKESKTYPTKTREVKSSTQKCEMIGTMLVPSEATCLFIFLGREGIVPGINPNKFS